MTLRRSASYWRSPDVSPARGTLRHLECGGRNHRFSKRLVVHQLWMDGLPNRSLKERGRNHLPKLLRVSSENQPVRASAFRLMCLLKSRSYCGSVPNRAPRARAFPVPRTRPRNARACGVRFNEFLSCPVISKLADHSCQWVTFDSKLTGDSERFEKRQLRLPQSKFRSPNVARLVLQGRGEKVRAAQSIWMRTECKRWRSPRCRKSSRTASISGLRKSLNFRCPSSVMLRRLSRSMRFAFNQTVTGP